MSNVNDTDSLHAELARLRAENEQLKAKKKAPITLKVSAKKAVSIYGMGRFPVTLYRNQWEQLFALQDVITKFIAEHADELSSQDDKGATPDAPAAAE